MTLSMHGKWGDPRQLARAANANAQASRSLEAPHGLMPRQIEDMQRRFETFLPKLAGRHGSRPTTAARFFDQMLPPGANLDPNAGAGLRAALDKAASLRRTGQVNIPGAGGSSGGSFSTPQTPYQPEFSSPDRQSYPVHRQLANIYWRMFYKLDPIVGTGIDMRSEMVWSNFTFTGEGVAGEIKDALDEMVEQTKLRAVLPFLTREFEVLGEVCPHLFYDDNQGIWTHIAIHNPDQLEVIWAPFLKMEPLIEFKPDDRLRQVVTSANPMLRAWRDSMPDEIKMALTSGRNIPLSPLNATFIPRRLHPYDVRGTSIMSRMWRLFMYEDSIYNASIAVARRAACFVAGTPVLTTSGTKPIEEVKIGDRVIAGNGRVETVENAWAEAPDGNGLIEIKAMGTAPLFCTPQHRFKVWVTPRNCACGCGTPIEATYEKTGRAKRRAFISGHHLNLLRDKKTGRMSAGADAGWKVYATEPKIRAPFDYEPIQKLEAKDIRVGDYLVIPRAFDLVETATRPEAARLLGYYAAEGGQRNLSARTETEVPCEGVTFSFSLEEFDTWAEDTIRCGAALGLDLTKYRHIPGADTKMARSGRVGRTTVYLQKQKDEHFASWLKEHAGDSARTHCLSEEVMGWPLELKKEFIRGYFRGDGHFGLADGCPQVTASSVSQTLIQQVRLILAQLGYFGSVFFTEKRAPGQENWSDCWAVSSTGRDARALAELIWGIRLDAPDREGKGTKSGGASRTWSDDEFIYVPVQGVEHHDDDVVTYNLSISGDHSYLVEVLQTFNSPLKVAKLGDAASGWIPGPESEQHLLELLTMAETDPTAWLVYNYAVNFDLIGVQERSWKIEQSSEYIERMKLIALGISKAFLWGEVTYASAQSGLTVFLRRLKATREYFESMWLYPKFLRPVAVMNRWIKPTEAELAHNVRTKRSVHELHEGNRFIVPKFEWEQSLDPSIDTSMIAAMKQLKDLGVEFSKSTYASLVNRDFDTELQQRIDDALHERKVLAQHPELQTALGAQPGAGGGGGGGGDIGGMLPALPPEAVGLDTPPPEDGEALPPEGLPPEGGEPPAAAAGDNAPHGGTTLLWDEHGRFEGWTKDDAADLAEVMRGEHPSEAPWERMVETWREQAQQGQRSPLRTLAGGEPVEIWSEVKDYLLMEGYPPKQVRGLEAILRHERVLPAKDDPRSPELLDTVGELGDAEFWTGAAQR